MSSFNDQASRTRFASGSVGEELDAIPPNSQTVSGVAFVNFCPGVEGNAGANRRNNRLFIDAILYRYRWKSSWRELPEEFGDWKNVHRRCIRWAKAGVWEKVFARLVAEADDKVVEERHSNAQKMTPEDRAELVIKLPAL